MKANDFLRVHFVNVNHGDATIIEFPDLRSHGVRVPRFGVVDFGAKKSEDRQRVSDYFEALVAHREVGQAADDYVIEFACVTHPHDDHYGGLSTFMARFDGRISAFWDCGFRTNSKTYNDELAEILKKPEIVFRRLSAGTEFHFDRVNVSVLAPSIDLRNRFDTWGVGKNDSSIVLRLKLGNSYVILAGDAEFASWAKITEEFPRMEKVEFYKDAIGMSERDDTADQLKCDLLKVSHHGSKRGTSFEYLERLDPNRIVFSAGNQNWYATRMSNWAGKFPHELVVKTFDTLGDPPTTFVTGDHGGLIFTYSGGWGPRHVRQLVHCDTVAEYTAELAAKW